MKDILLNTDFDLLTADGDLVVGESTSQHQQLLIVSAKGDFKENPTIAVGAGGYLKDEDETGLMAEIKIEFEKDGMIVNEITINNGNIEVNANY